MTGKPSKAAPVARAAGVAAQEDHIGLERLIFFSDAVFAIAITLLALEIRLPGEPATLDNGQLLAALLGIWQSYLAYIVSFLVIGTYWMTHHRKFRLIKRYDGTLLLINLFLLMGVAFVPFPTAVISSNPNRTATIFYALTMAVIGLFFAILWWYASANNRLTDASLTAAQRRRGLLSPLLTSGIFMLSIGLAFINADLAKYAWLLIVPVVRYTRAA